jgi:hypothetical protein
MDQLKIICGDIETLKEYGLLSFFEPVENKWYEFEVNKWKNDLFTFKKFCERLFLEGYYVIWFNGITFDMQVIEFILRNMESNDWVNATNLEICHKIWQFAQDTIDDQNFGIFSKYREEDFSFKIIDLFKLWAFDNEARMVSLKALQFEMNYPFMEEMPIAHDKIDMTKEEIELTRDYCRNDILSMYEFYKISRGETEHPLYKGKDKVQLRFDIKEPFGFPDKAISYSELKIGDEYQKIAYLKEIGKEGDFKHVYELKKKAKFKTGFKFKECFPDYMNFELPEFKAFVKKWGDVKVNMNEKQDFTFKYNGTEYSFGKGGCHSVNKPSIIIPQKGEKFLSCDVGSMYPNCIRKRKIFPKHLGESWWKVYIKNINKRLDAKKLYKDTKDKKYDSIQESFKLVLNVLFGKLNERTNWQYDGFAAMCVTVGCQIDLLMLIEDFEMGKLHPIIANTDGLECMIPEDKVSLYYEICKKWEKDVGNDILGNLEYVEYTKMIMTSVNDYIAVSTEPKIKVKGDFVEDFELWKNKSRRVVPIALKKYFIDGIPIEETLKKHDNIYDFCIRQKSSKNFHYEGNNPDTKHKNIYKKLIRYYVSNKGEKLLKIKNPECTTNAASVSQVEAGEWLMTVENDLIKEDISNYDIDYQYYIDKAYKIIDKVEKRNKQNPNQTSLF